MKESAPTKGGWSDEPTGRVLWQVRPEGHLEPVNVRTSSSNGDVNQLCCQPVETRLAVDAAVCGSLGCCETDGLLKVELSGKERVLCPECATGFVERSRAQSERGLDSAERSAEAEPEARGSGKSDGKRSDRSETSGGSGGGVRR